MFALAALPRLSAVLAALVCAGSLLAQQIPPAPGPTAGPQVQDNQLPAKDAQPRLPAAPAIAPVDPTTYKIGVQDVVDIRVWRQPDVSGTVAVRPDGRINLPLVGDLPVVDMTPDQLSKELTKRLGEFYQNPQVNISVVQVRSKRYFITGNASRVGEFPLVKPITVMEALTAAGGFRPFAKTKKIMILRGSERLYFNYNDYVRGKNMDKNFELKDGDYIVVR